MNKSKTMKKGTTKVRNQNAKQWLKNALNWVKGKAVSVWNFICRVFRAFWNWLKSIDIIGMINLTLLVAIIVLFVSLISNFVGCDNHSKNTVAKKTEIVSVQKAQPVDNRKVVERRFKTVVPVKVATKPVSAVSVKSANASQPQLAEIYVQIDEEPSQVLSGDVIVERSPASPVLSNGVKVNGNLYIQNMNKYTIPCDAKINGHLFIRNVARVNFCGKFKVNGNVYVNRESLFGPLPSGTKINGQIIL